MAVSTSYNLLYVLKYDFSVQNNTRMFSSMLFTKAYRFICFPIMCLENLLWSYPSQNQSLVHTKYKLISHLRIAVSKKTLKTQLEIWDELVNTDDTVKKTYIFLYNTFRLDGLSRTNVRASMFYTWSLVSHFEWCINYLDI